LTEIDDLGALFRPGPPLTPEQVAHIQAVQEFEKQMLLERMEAVQFLAPILCTCRPYYKWASRLPTQARCPIHGMMLAHPYTGEPILPGMPLQPGTFTPEAGERHPPGRTNDEEER
jgi:hypothetical protein